MGVQGEREGFTLVRGPGAERLLGMGCRGEGTLALLEGQGADEVASLPGVEGQWNVLARYGACRSFWVPKTHLAIRLPESDGHRLTPLQVIGTPNTRSQAQVVDNGSEEGWAVGGKDSNRNEKMAKRMGPAYSTAAMRMSITMNGADSAHLEKVKAESSRVVAFPDGVSRMIRLTALQWEVFDRWEEFADSPKSELTGQALLMAYDVRDTLGSQTFEEDVRLGITVVLDGLKTWVASVQLNAENENIYPANRS